LLVQGAERFLGSSEFLGSSANEFFSEEPEEPPAPVLVHGDAT
jgi:hypothetical protein